MAAITITVALPAIPLLQGDQAHAILRLEVGTAMTGIVEDIASHARDHVHVGVSGLLRAGIGARVLPGADASTLMTGEVSTGAQTPYAEAVEYGSVPHWPPWGAGSALRLWVERVIGDVDVTYLIARKISRKGTPAQHYMRNAQAAIEPSIQGRLQRGVDRAAARMLGGV